MKKLKHETESIHKAIVAGDCPAPGMELYKERAMKGPDKRLNRFFPRSDWSFKGGSVRRAMWPRPVAGRSVALSFNRSMLITS